MNLLQKTLEGEISQGALARMIANLLVSKLAKKGVALSERERRTLYERVRAGDYSRVTLRPWHFWKKEQVELEITEDDLQQLERSVDALVQRVPEVVERLSAEVAGTLLSSLEKRWRREARRQRRQMAGFCKRLDYQWRRPFGLLQMLLTLATEFGESVNERLRLESSSNLHKIEVLTRLHARACQVGSEVLALLRQGFADGALARWRTLHEIAVVSLFLAEGDDALSERYMLHEIVESCRAANEYQKFCDRLGYERLDDAQLISMEQRKAVLIDQFGKPFEEQYGWAAQQLGKVSPTFAEIERAVGIEHLRPFYRMASHNVHANPKGAFFKLGLVGERDILLVGPSNTGFADAGQNTALSIVHTAIGLMILDPTVDALVMVQIMMRLEDRIGDAFLAVQKTVEGVVA